VDKEILPKQMGNKTECGLLNVVAELGSNYEHIRAAYPEEDFLHVYTFNSVRKSMSTVIQRSDTVRLHIKGASEIVLKSCNTILDHTGQIKPLTDDDRNHLLNDVIEPMACDGLRTICIAYKEFSHMPNDWYDEENIVDDLTCICLCGIEDPVRPEVDLAIRMIITIYHLFIVRYN
jgi:P-type Ca2+ transporter type 2B